MKSAYETLKARIESRNECVPESFVHFYYRGLIDGCYAHADVMTTEEYINLLNLLSSMCIG